MQDSFDKSGDSTLKRIYRDWGIGVFLLPVLIVITLIGASVFHQGSANWIAEAAQAEFVGTDLVPDVAPTKVAQPVRETQTAASSHR
jgi:hypothetical protein